MDALTRWRGPESGTPLEGDRRIEAFRATDAFVTGAARAAAEVAAAGGAPLAHRLVEAVLTCGAELLRASHAAAGSGSEAEALGAAERGLVEARYALYLARRLGLVDLRKYRSLSSQHDAAAREVAAIRGPRAAPASPRGP